VMGMRHQKPERVDAVSAEVRAQHGGDSAGEMRGAPAGVVGAAA